jgi:serine phosphatase RsbU (regulator of sigma subunit)
MNIIERVSLVDTGLKLSEKDLNNRLNQAFVPFINAYVNSSGDLSLIDYSGIKRNVSRTMNLTADLYVINRGGIIIESTIPEVIGLNLSQNPDYAHSVPIMIDGSSYVTDRIVRSYTSADARNLTGELRKFAFTPTPDHRYLLEIGVSDVSFSESESNLSYYLISDEMSDINPYLQTIRIFDIHKNLYVKGGIEPPDSLDSITNTQLDQVINARSELSFQNDDQNIRIQYLFIDMSGPDTVSDMSVIVEIAYSNALLDNERFRLLMFFSAVGCLIMIIGGLLTFWACRMITTPVTAIVEDVDQIAQGDLDYKIRSMEVREFVRLEQSINQMIQQIKTKSKEIERRKTELLIAAEIQQSFLPDTLPDICGYDIAAKNLPAKEIGGDFYDVIHFNDIREKKNKYGILIADVSGKGVPAALFMALSRTIVRIAAEGESDPEQAIKQANNFITADARTGMFVSLFYAVVSGQDGRMGYVNAGHNPPVVFHAHNNTTSLLDSGGIVLGIDTGMEFKEADIDICPGDIVVFYTDGVTEAVDNNVQQYGEERLCQVITAHAKDCAHDIIDAIVKDVSAFVGDVDQFDDITLVVLKRESAK